MAKTVYKEETFLLQDGKTEVKVQPMVIKQMKKFIAVSKAMQDEEVVADEAKMLDVLFELTSIAIEKNDPSLAKDTERLEDLLDVPTIYEILNIASGINFDPKE